MFLTFRIVKALDSRMGTGSLGEESRLSHASDWATALLSKITGKNQNPNVSVVITKVNPLLAYRFHKIIIRFTLMFRF